MLCAKEKYWSHQGVIWQLVGGPRFRQSASCAQQMALFCPLLSSQPPTDDPKNPSQTLLQINTKAVQHQNQMSPS